MIIFAAFVLSHFASSVNRLHISYLNILIWSLSIFWKFESFWNEWLRYQYIVWSIVILFYCFEYTEARREEYDLQKCLEITLNVAHRY